MQHGIKVSFCITCMGRLTHLQQTLLRNFDSNADFPQLEFVLLDYSSPDALEQWVQGSLTRHVESGQLLYAKVDECSFFHPAHAKNICHRLARGTVVCNLDADNFTGDGFAEYLWHYFSGNAPNRILHANGIGGTFGRIAMLKSAFEALGGYDERFEQGWGYEDNDFLLRAKNSRYQVEPIPSAFCSAIVHGDSERVQYCSEKDVKKSRHHHKQLSSMSLAQGRFVANQGRQWGAARLRVNFETSITL